jgi:hypothetical protein
MEGPVVACDFVWGTQWPYKILMVIFLAYLNAVLKYTMLFLLLYFIRF